MRDLRLGSVLALPVLFWLVLLAGPSKAAQSETASYLESTDPYLSQMARLDAQFLAIVPQLQKSRDLVAMQKALSDLSSSWAEVGKGLAELAPPSDCEEYHAALARLVEVQMACHGLVLQTAERGLALTAEVQSMKEAGASEEALQARIADFSEGRGQLTEQLMSLRAESKALDETLRVERERLQGSSP